MKRLEHLQPGGVGVMATAGLDGAVNTAVYAPPHVTDDGTAAWGMSEGRTYRNVRGNPNASYLYIFPGGGYRGVRLTLRRKEIQDSGNILEMIRARTRESSGEGPATAIKYVTFFEILEERPLV
ncbi:MAG: pyridoxamine 5'-phosphate oxidase family protein [Deltaproteobacteria bacterium]|nr:pyridoxamine 5'-phosphate oxidase family protein [Deltaproteobacteria bacterium]